MMRAVLHVEDETDQVRPDAIAVAADECPRATVQNLHMGSAGSAVATPRRYLALALTE